MALNSKHKKLILVQHNKLILLQENLMTAHHENLGLVRGPCQHGQDYPANCSKCYPLNDATALNIVRNPYGWSPGQIQEAALYLADQLEGWKKSYAEVLEWARKNGLDTTIHYGGGK